jgi:hypothetical protein
MKIKGYVYVYFPSQITALLEKIQKTGQPDKLTITYVQKTWLLADAKYSAVIELLKAMGFLDDAGVPTPLYAEYANPTIAKEALAKGITNAYPDLIKAYPNPLKLTEDELKGFVKQHTGGDPAVVRRVSGTISTLCSMAFDAVTVVPLDKETDRGQPQNPPPPPEPPVKVNPNIQLNFELHFAADMPDEKIEAIFKNMKKYLLSDNE